MTSSRISHFNDQLNYVKTAVKGLLTLAVNVRALILQRSNYMHFTLALPTIVFQCFYSRLIPERRALPPYIHIFQIPAQHFRELSEIYMNHMTIPHSGPHLSNSSNLRVSLWNHFDRKQNKRQSTLIISL